MKDLNQCKWCEASIKIGDGPTARPEWKRWRCNGCGAFGYINDPTNEELDRVYKTAWQDSELSGTFAAGSTTEHIAYSLLNAIRWSPSTNDKCLDYGGGRGHFANALLNNPSCHLDG